MSDVALAENAFRDLLGRGKARTGKTFPQLLKALEGVKRSALASWHDGRAIPPEGLLPRIAVVYGFEEAEVRAAYEKTRAALESIKMGRRVAARKPDPVSPFTPAVGASSVSAPGFTRSPRIRFA